MRFSHIVALGLVLGLGLAIPARAESIGEVIEGLRHTQASLKDVTLRLKGKIRQGAKLLDGELQIEAIPAQELRRLSFRAPAAMAGNVLVLDHHQVSSYLALTHQIVRADWNAAARNAPMDFSRMSALSEGTFAADQFKIVGTEALAAGSAVVLAETAEPCRLKVWVLKDGWRLGRIQVLNAQGLTQADWTVAEFRPNTGLTAATLRDLPQDAAVIQK